MSNKAKSSEKRWTKQEFLDAVRPCGYRWRIRWLFLRHPRGVKVLHVVNAWYVDWMDKLYVIDRLDHTLWREHWGETAYGYKESFASMKAELRNK